MQATNEDCTLRLRIEQDDDPMSPRDWDNFGHMVCWHSRYILGDEQPNDDPNRWLHEWLRGRKERDYVILPLFLYDHSGITMSTSRFSCIWDSGQVGWIFATREHAEKIGAPWDGLNAIAKSLEAEVEVYDQYISGNVWGFVAEKQCTECHNWELVDSCGGFFGTDWDNNGMKEHLSKEYHELLEELP